MWAILSQFLFLGPGSSDMFVRMRILPLLLIAVCTLGCSGGGEEASHEGKTLSEWMSQAKGKDPVARLAAYEALGTFRGDAAAADALQERVGSDATAGAERIVAAKNLYRATGDAGRVIAPVRAVVRAEADSTGGLQSIKEVEDLVFWLGARAEPLADDLRYAAGKIRGRDAQSGQRRQRVRQVLEGIPKG